MPPEKGLLAELSPELQAAQEKLYGLRAALGIVPRLGNKVPLPATPALPPVNWSLRNAQLALQQVRERDGLGLHKPTSTTTLMPPTDLGRGEAPPTNQEPTVFDSKGVIAHPTMVLAMLKQGLEAPGRVYFLLRVIDTDGRGWLEIQNIRRLLTQKESPWRICGWRRLRQLLKQGEGVFWQRDAKDRLWLKGTHKIAYTLDCDRLAGSPVLLPVSSLLGGIQAVRGAFYAAFHSGRASKPISRQTLEEVTGVAERTQRVYDRVARVSCQSNLALGERYTKERFEARAWNQGRAVFRFVDTRGLHGRPQADYIAWHIPNSYAGPYTRRSKANRRRVNRKLADLVKKGIPGTSKEQVTQLFWSNGALAAKGYNRRPYLDAYWAATGLAPRCQFWRVMPSIARK